MTPADLGAAATVVLSWLLTYAVHSTILLAVAAVVTWRFADQHAWLDLIWKVALIAPVLTASVHFDPIALPVGGRWTMPDMMAVSGTTEVTSAPFGEAPITPAIPVERVTSSPVSDRPAESDRATPSSAARSTFWKLLRAWPSIAVVTWLIFAVVVLVRYVLRLRRVYRALGSGAPVTTAELLDTIERLRSGANQRPIRVTTNAACPVPLALGGRHIVLPERFLSELDPEQQRAALAHELAHVARRDPEWRIAVDVFERALFFQPLNRLARARLCDAAEFLCDEWAVQRTQSPLAMARCLSVVASWWSPADELPAGVSAMARSDSAMVRRVTRILNEPSRIARRPRLLWLAIPVAVVALAAPRVTARQLPAPAVVTPSVAAMLSAVNDDKAAAQRELPRQISAPEIAAAKAQLRVHRSAAGGTLEERWRQALAGAGRQGFTDFWIVYTFNTPTHADDMVVSDTNGDSLVSSDGRISMQGPPLTALFNPPAAVPLEGGNLAVLLHYRAAREDAIDRAGYRSVQLGFAFGRTPVFWLGDAPESQSFERVRSLFDQGRARNIQVLLIELASLHSNTDVVAPFLTRLLDPSSWPSEIRSEAAEGFDHHHDPRSVEILLRVARTDPDSGVRAEAAETIGEVQTPQSIPALTELVNESADPEVRREAAEAFADQPAASALPALERVIASNEHEDVVSEAIEALGEFDDPAAMAALERIALEHDREEVQAEAIETLGDREEEPLHPLILELAVSGKSARIRKEALDQIGDAVAKIGDAAALDRAQQVIERAIFDDPDQSVRMEALDALDELPEARALQVLRDVIARHSDARVRREAEENLRERRQ